MFKKLVWFLIIPVLGFSKTISLDKDVINVSLKNNSMNLLVFPFVVQDAKLTTDSPDDFQVKAKNTTVMILPTMLNVEKESDLIVWSSLGDAYILRINGKNDSEQKFTFSSNYVTKKNSQIKKFESGKIEQDIKNLIKKVVNEEPISGYKKIDVKKMFETEDLLMQKEYFYDGGKYRVETWYLENKTNDILSLDYENFYTNGILAISFESRTLQPGQIGKMWLIINKATVAGLSK